MTAPAGPVDRKRVTALMAAFRYGGSVDDLGKVDARRESGRYDEVMWHVALDGATLAGLGSEFREHLEAALAAGWTEAEAERVAYETTAKANGFTV